MAGKHDLILQMPPLENWAAQTYAYGFLLDRTRASIAAAAAYGVPGGADIPTADDIHLLNLNPKDINEEEPFATRIAMSFDGGKVRESRGGIHKSITIRGTTGFLPPVAPHATHMRRQANLLVPVEIDSVEVMKQSTGFFEFYRLRQLFRTFGQARKAGKLIDMHWLNFKADEFWVIEPLAFSMHRGRFTYEYDIRFDLIEPSKSKASYLGQGFDAFEFEGARTSSTAELLALVRNNPIGGTLDPATRTALDRVNEMTQSAVQFTQQFSLGFVAVKWQALLTLLGQVQQTFAAVSTIRRTALDIPMTLLRQTYSAVQGLQTAYSEMADDGFRADINEWSIEMQFLIEGLTVSQMDKYSSPGSDLSDKDRQYVERRAVQGTTNQLMQEVAGAKGSPPASPFIGVSGLSLMTDVEALIKTTTFKPEYVLTGESIYDVAQRTLGDAQRFIELIVFNRLEAPYVVASALNRPPGTIAWGESILVPVSTDSEALNTALPAAQRVSALEVVTTSAAANAFDVLYSAGAWREDQWTGFTVEIMSGPQAGQKRIVVSNDDTSLSVNRAFGGNIGDTVTFRLYLELFSARRTPTPETAAYGRDIMLVFPKSQSSTQVTGVDVMIAPHGDIATVEGIDNLEQAIAVTLNTVRGSNKALPNFGTTSVVGRKFEPNMAALHLFFVRQALLADSRIESIERPRIEFDAGTMWFDCQVKPVDARRTLLFRIPIA